LWNGFSFGIFNSNLFFRRVLLNVELVSNDSVVDSVPRSLVELVLIIEHGPDIKSHIENGLAKSDFAIAQLLYFNSHTKWTKNTSEHSRHSSDREPPRMLTKLDAEKQIYRCHDMKLLLLLEKDYDLCCQLQTLWINLFAKWLDKQRKTFKWPWTTFCYLCRFSLVCKDKKAATDKTPCFSMAFASHMTECWKYLLSLGNLFLVNWWKMAWRFRTR
jgi:hypothetical protein